MFGLVCGKGTLTDIGCSLTPYHHTLRRKGGREGLDQLMGILRSGERFPWKKPTNSSLAIRRVLGKKNSSEP